MVEEYTGVALDKSESRTDWLARPLSERQCEYAAADVWYLLPIAKKLMIETEAAGWLPAALDECRLMQQRRQEIQAPEEAWRDITNARQLRTRQLACLQLLADWRLRKARERDMAVNFVVREENLWAVARYMPGSLGELDSRAFRQRDSFSRQDVDIAGGESTGATGRGIAGTPVESDGHAGLSQSV